MDFTLVILGSDEQRDALTAASDLYRKCGFEVISIPNPERIALQERNHVEGFKMVLSLLKSAFSLVVIEDSFGCIPDSLTIFVAFAEVLKIPVIFLRETDDKKDVTISRMISSHTEETIF